MKILRFFAVFAIVVGMVSCATMNTQTTQRPSTTQIGTNSAAYAAGAACGNSLLALYNQYKTEGKIDLSNPNSIIHLTTLASSSAYLKANSKNKTYYQEFVRGTVSGSRDVITTALTGKLLNSLTNIDLSSLNQRTATPSYAKAVSSVVNLLKLMKQ